MIAALADAGAVLGRDDYLDAARDAAAFVLDRMRTPDGRLLRTFNAGHGDAWAPTSRTTPSCSRRCSSLYEATFEERWFVEARALADTIVARFGDPERGGFFSTADDHEALIARRKDLEDSPIPSGGSGAALGLLRLAALTGEHAYEEQARASSRCCTRSRRAPPGGVRAPAAGARPLPRAAARGRAGRRPRLAMRRWPPSSARRAGRTSCSPPARARADRRGAPAQRTPVDGRAAAYVCERFACRTPVTEPDELRALLERGAPSTSESATDGYAATRWCSFAWPERIGSPPR